MRKISKEVCTAFLQGKSFRKGNSGAGKFALYLHDNKIARKHKIVGDTVIYATLAGWPTPTTRERLNTLCSLLNIKSRFFQKGRKQFFYDEITDNIIEISSTQEVVLKTI